jgi:ankyrin repeat protein
MLRLMLEHDSSLGYEINSLGDSLLIDAALRGQVAAGQELLKHCPDAPYYCTEGGRGTLLHQGVWYDHAEFVEFVLKEPLLRKVVNMQNNNGATALHNAVQNCNPRIVVGLLSHENIDVTVLDKLGSPAAWQLWGFIENAKTLNWVRTHATDSIDHA